MSKAARNYSSKWEKKHGSWSAREERSRNAKGHAGAAAGPHTLIAIDPARNAGESARLDLSYINMAAALLWQRLIKEEENKNTKEVASYWQSAFFEMPQATRISVCEKCGAAHKADAKHECPIATGHDLAVVRTIQSLAGGGLSAKEIAADMGLVVGWRVWGIGGHGLTGAGIGSRVIWALDKPVLAVCTHDDCAADGHINCGSQPPEPVMYHGALLREERAGRAFIHAALNRGALKIGDTDWRAGKVVLGRVAMWGDVIHCQLGLLSSRAYPLSLPEGWARMYRVCTDVIA